MRAVVEYNPIDLRSENEVETDRKARLDNLIEAETNFYITPQEVAEDVRIMFGLDNEIPPLKLANGDDVEEEDEQSHIAPSIDRLQAYLKMPQELQQRNTTRLWELYRKGS